MNRSALRLAEWKAIFYIGDIPPNAGGCGFV